MYRPIAPAIVLIAFATAIATRAYAEEVRSADPQLQDVIIADELRTAFYEHAPARLSASISKAVRSWCSGADRAKLANGNKPVGWLCAKNKLRYFRSVYISGEKGPHALVCEDNGTSSLKYFGVDLVADVIQEESCVSAEFNGTTYELYFVNVGGADDAPEAR